jgi:hypothetical protein
LSRTLKGIIEKTMTAGHEMSGDDADIILVSTIQTDPASVELAKKEIEQKVGGRMAVGESTPRSRSRC